MNLIKYFTLLFFVMGSHFSFAQKIDSLSLDTLYDAEIRLMGLAENMVTSYDEGTRISSGTNFIRTLVRALRIKHAYDFPFDSLKKNVSILKSSDDLFRIFTWNVASNDENFRYFGVIQMNPQKIKKYKDTINLRMYYPLIDRSDSINDLYFAELDQNHWFGATYYKIIKTTSQKGAFYTLLGWDGSTIKSNKKVVDVLIFRNNKPYFGSPIFDLKGKKLLSRMVWEFNNRASMTLRYEVKKKMLIYENIVPQKAANSGMYETYIPDGSYDFMIWKNGVWEKQPGMVRDFKME